MLWEIGDGADLRELRNRLGLDSGYLSRLLGALQRRASSRPTPAPTSAPATVALTAEGRAERAAARRALRRARHARCSRRSSAIQRARLVEAMGTVERLLTASLVEIAVERPDSHVARYCLRQYFHELDESLRRRLRPRRRALPDRGAPSFLVARLRGEPVGCGAIKLAEPLPSQAHVDRPRVRGLGLGRRLLLELEQRRATPASVQLETNRVLTEAIAIYRATGYHEVAPFNDEPYAHHWFEKRALISSARMAVTELSRIFKAYDVRGLYGQDIDGDTAEAVGRGLRARSPTCRASRRAS